MFNSVIHYNSLQLFVILFFFGHSIFNRVLPEQEILDDDEYLASKYPSSEEGGNNSGPGGIGDTSGTSELVLWLKADSGVVKDANNLVSEWQDQSGHFHNVSQSNINNQPIFEEDALCSGADGLLFSGLQTNGSNDFLNNTVDNLMAPNKQRTLFVVADMRDNSTTGGTFLTSRRSGSIFENQIYIAPTDGGTYIYSDGVNVSNNATVSGSVFTQAKQPFIATFYTETNKKQRLRMNGVSSGVSQSGATIAETGATGFTVGHREDVPFGPWYGQTWDGHISEIILYDRQLTITEIEAVEAYLGAKYCNLILPITWGDFIAVANENNAELEWNTLSEFDNSHFEIEHSLDGLTFNKIGEVPANNVASLYRYVHDDPGKGIHYYRIKQIDLDGSIDYSHIAVLHFDNSNDLYVYPNPVNYQLIVNGAEEVQNYQIIGLDGKIWKEESLTNGRIVVEDLPAGLYILKIIKEDTIHTIKFLKR